MFSGSVCFVVGARPNFMKVAPVHRALGAIAPTLDIMLIHTGQHYDRRMSDVFLDELGMPAVDVFLGVGSGSHGEQTARALAAIEVVLIEKHPALVVVAGDVNSTLAAAIAAVKLHIPVAHIESGLRSFDWAMPEEHNRRLTDHVSSVLLVHSPNAIANLTREGIDPARIHLVGNTMIDTMFSHLETARERKPWREFGVARGKYGLVTLHRPSLVDDLDLLEEAVDSLVELASLYPLVFPLHPRTKAHLTDRGLDQRLTRERVILTEPLAYLTFLGLEAEAAFVLTDSGGVQEETSALGIPCYTLRDSTERPITIEQGTNILLGARPDRMREIPELLARRPEFAPIPLWDGRAGERAAKTLATFLEAPEAASSLVA